ncbi:TRANSCRIPTION FACTOR BHLH52-RELATED [Salix purpurea]|uniref:TRANSCRIPTION FACTOR BHLH52-RELATED n=1 Tax=Salix purpurea TaxID=77065 RepID=A0A9Q1A0B5_SALPP|nr:TRANSCRIPTION FACTOR BHLH52-RELATED [Salix purpurea]
MALSFCSNMGSSLHHHNLPEIGNHELFGCNDSLMFSDTFINPLYEIWSPTHARNDKKLYTDHFNTDFATGFFEGHLPGPPESLPEIPVPVPVPEPKFQVPTTFNAWRTESVMNSKKQSSGVGLSAQSIAARERRRKITEKTHELAKLVPGGNKMNTAEMFPSCLQMLQEDKVAMHAQELQTLVTSPTIQEKLYLEQKCLVPRDFVQTIADDCEIQAKPLIVEEIDHEFLGEEFLE